MRVLFISLVAMRRLLQVSLGGLSDFCFCGWPVKLGMESLQLPLPQNCSFPCWPEAEPWNRLGSLCSGKGLAEEAQLVFGFAFPRT